MTTERNMENYQNMPVFRLPYQAVEHPGIVLTRAPLVCHVCGEALVRVRAQVNEYAHCLDVYGFGGCNNKKCSNYLNLSEVRVRWYFKENRWLWIEKGMWRQVSPSNKTSWNWKNTFRMFFRSDSSPK